MTIPDKIKSFLSEATDISLGYSDINFVDASNVADGHVGYSIHPNGGSLITGNTGGWQQDWLVIASDEMGDPIMVDISSPNLTILSAAHGEGSWEPYIIADSFENFTKIVSIIQDMSKGRGSPVELENNPISDMEIRIVLTNIERQNPGSEISYWGAFFENNQ